MEDMTMKMQFEKWMPVLALACFAAAVFMIAEGYYWFGIILIGAGACLSSAAAVYRKKKDAADKDQETKWSI